MQCPYCVSEIDNEALACPHCARDLYLFKPLLSRISELEQKLALLDARVDEVNPAVSAPLATPIAIEEPAPNPLAAAVLWVIPLVLLLAAHSLITITYDLNTLYLRIVSLLIPLPFGVLLMSRQQRHFGWWTVAAFAMATFAVFGMSWITHLVDHTPVLPQDRREWKEFIEYAASVGFSLITGMLIGRVFWRRNAQAVQATQAGSVTEKFAHLITNGEKSAEKIHTSVKKINDLGNSFAAAGTTAVSVYTGLKGFLGDS